MTDCGRHHTGKPDQPPPLLRHQSLVIFVSASNPAPADRDFDAQSLALISNVMNERPFDPEA
jgi:hypothetical protein